jgi:hypothetical protein
MEMTLGGDMPTHPRQHSEDTQIQEKILKESAQPRQSTSVKDVLDKKKAPLSVAPQTVGGNKGVKIRALKPE